MESRAAEVRAGSQNPRVRKGSSMKGMTIVLVVLLVLTAAMIFWVVTDDVPVIDEPLPGQSQSTE
jgi:flagellar basal body-associated protein FliL